MSEYRKAIMAVLLLSGASLAQDRQAEDALKAEIVKGGGSVKPGFTEVVLVGEQVNDDLLQRLVPYGEQLRLIRLKNTSVTGIGIRGLVFFRNLKSAHLSDNEVKAGGLKSVSFIKGLSGISVVSESLTDNDLADISAVKWISSLGISLTGTKNVTPKGLSQLASMKSLSTLSIKSGPPGITDEHLAAVASLGSLEDLSLYPTCVTDKGITAFSKLKKLKKLNLYESDVTDDGLEVFAGMPELKSVSLMLAKTTKEAAAIMKMKAPKVRFYATTR